MAKRQKYYFDTTIFNFYFAEDEPIKRNITKQLLDNWREEKGEIYISEVVLREIGRCDEEKRLKLLNLISKLQPLSIEVDEECDELAEKYITNGIIPEKYRNDALHIAVAVVNDMDILLSWNFEHIVKVKTRIGVNGLDKILGYKEIEIASPEEVL